jgi:hypothetical protein
MPAKQPYAFLPEGEHEMLIVYKPQLRKNQRLHAQWALRVQYSHFRRSKAANQLWYDAWSPLHWELYDDARICWPVAEEDFSEEEAYRRSTARWATSVRQTRPASQDRIYGYEGELYIPEGVSADAEPAVAARRAAMLKERQKHWDPVPIPGPAPKQQRRADATPPAAAAAASPRRLPPVQEEEDEELAAARRLIASREAARRSEVGRYVPEGVPRLDETHRKRAVDFTRALTALKGNVGDDSSEKEVNEWKHKVESHAIVCFGSHWEQVPTAVESVLRAIHEGFTKKLQSAWVLETQHDPSLITTMSWDDLVEWVYSHTTHEPYNEGRENRTKLMSCQVMQKGSTLNAYLLHFNRMVLPVEGISEEEKIVYFMRGLSNDLGPLCQTDIKGQPWTDYTELVDHARMKELELRARTAALKKTTQNTHGRRWNNAHTVASIAKGDNVDTPPASQGSGQRGKNGSSWRNRGGRGSGVGGRGLAVVQGGTAKHSGRGSGRGGGRGGGAKQEGHRPSGAAAEPYQSKALVVSGPDDSACQYNTGISNKQARWLQERQRCFHCFRPMSGPDSCPRNRKERYKCDKRGAGQELAEGTVPGCPGWT